MTIDPQLLLFKSGKPQVEVDDETGCWIWQGSKTRGYGRVRRGRRSSVGAHKVLWERVYGPLGSSMVLGHTCHRRSCVNIYHVRPVSAAQNDKERYQIPRLGKKTTTALEAAIKSGDKPLKIQNDFGISCWFIRKVAKYIDQYKLFEAPF